MSIMCNNFIRENSQRKQQGFTLLEILIALFIFSILSLLMAAGLRTVINAQSGTEMSADRLRELQFATLIFSRDIEQAVNRPVKNAEGKEEHSFVGTKEAVTFTHAGNAAFTSSIPMSQLARTRYEIKDNILWRIVWDQVDATEKTKSHRRPLLSDVSAIIFSYLDEKKKFHDKWPSSNENKLPLAVRMTIKLGKWGSISQLYVLSAQPPQQIPGQAAQPKPESR